jgi:hypothetical protein
MDWWVRRRTHAFIICGDIFLVVHGDLTVAPDANLGRRLGDHKGAKIRWNLRSSVCCGQLQSFDFKFHVGVRAARIEAAAHIQGLSGKIQNEWNDKHAVLIVLKAGHRVPHLVHGGPVGEQRQVARGVHGVRLVVRMAHIIDRPVISEVAASLLVGDARAEGMEVEVVGRGQLGELGTSHPATDYVP